MTAHPRPCTYACDTDVLDGAEDQLPSREAAPHFAGLSGLVVPRGPELIATPGPEENAPRHPALPTARN
jgi:hypothetical protein